MNNRRFDSRYLMILLLVAVPGSAFAREFSENQIGNSVYYVLWAGLVASGILASRSNLGQSLRHLAIWIFIIFGLSAAYIYKNDLQNIGARVTAGLIPGRASSYKDTDGFENTVLYKSDDGHFYAEATLNGKAIPLMVDTGASVVALTFEDAQAIGIDPGSLAFNESVSTANGIAKTATTKISLFELGGIKRTMMTVQIAQPGQMRESLLGMNFLNSLRSFSFEGNELRLKD